MEIIGFAVTAFFLYLFVARPAMDVVEERHKKAAEEAARSGQKPLVEPGLAPRHTCVDLTGPRMTGRH